MQAADRFHFLADMARLTPGYRLTVPWDRQRLPQVRAALQGASAETEIPWARKSREA
jgi:hypothetical protein